MPSLRRELLLSLIVLASFWAVSVQLNLSERLFAFAATHESWQLDEICVAFMFFCMWLVGASVTWAHVASREASLRIAAQELAFTSARYDPLTGLPNRLYLSELASAALDRSSAEGLRCALLFVDLDRFKDINDTLGHAAGDELLVKVAKALQEQVPAPGLVARLAGDEFAVLLSDLNGDDAPCRTAKRIAAELANPIDLSGHPVRIGVTIGVAIGPRDGSNAADLLKAADMAMYEGKRAGRDTVHLYQAA